MILHLNLKAKWFDMIASGEKTEEYREIKPYWIKRLFNADFGSYPLSETYDYMKEGLRLTYNGKNRSVIPKFDFVVIKNGYQKDAPSVKLECLSVTIGPAKPEWSDNWQGDVFIIKLGKIISK